MANLRLVMAYIHHGFESHILCKAANNISFFFVYVYTRIHEKKRKNKRLAFPKDAAQKKNIFYFIIFN